jgi:hypothetical protein
VDGDDSATTAVGRDSMEGGVDGDNSAAAMIALRDGLDGDAQITLFSAVDADTVAEGTCCGIWVAGKAQLRPFSAVETVAWDWIVRDTDVATVAWVRD